jgi:uncharacterized protein
MVTDLRALRAVNISDEAQFGTLMKKVLSPSEPLESPEQLRGRDEQLTEIRRALYASGRHVFIHGFRGVGKTSLAQTAAYQIQSSDARPIVLGCSLGTTVNELVRDVLDEALAGDPRVVKATIERGFSAGTHGLSASLAKSLEMGSVPLPTSLNEAVRMLSFFGQLHSKAPVVVIDESA